jgi:23S rRNA pseudouridine2605 synthase
VKLHLKHGTASAKTDRRGGIASRRHAEELIAAGRVTVNGEVIKELGTKADPEKDHIKVNGKLINPQLKSREKTYVLLNKPKGYLSSVSDPEGRPLVTELLPPALGKLHPVGRLDFNTEGLLLTHQRRRLHKLCDRGSQSCRESLRSESERCAD